MAHIIDMESGATIQVRSGGALDYTSGASLTLCGEVRTPPTFDNVTLELGETAANCGCSTNRDAIVRFRAQQVSGGIPSGPYFLSDWESIAKMTGHLRQIEGLSPDTEYRVEIQIDALEDPDLDWTEFEDGLTDCCIVMPGPGTPNPEKPVEREEP